MKLAFVAPNAMFLPGFAFSEDDDLSRFIGPHVLKFRRHTPNESLLQLAALTPRGHEITFMDDQFGDVRLDSDVDLVAITVMTINAVRAYEIADAWRARGVPVVMGGIHATLLPDEALAHADAVVTGDADAVWRSVLRDFQRGKAQRMYHGGLCDLRSSPPPRIGAYPPERYRRSVVGTEVYNLRVSAGCSRKCRYCSNWGLSGGTRLRTKSLKQIDAELRQIARRSDSFILSLTDDNLFLDVDFAMGLLRRIKRQGVRWAGGADVSVVRHPQLLNLMRESGCFMIYFGFESLDAKNLEWLSPWKAAHVPRYREAIRKVRDRGIDVAGAFMVGLEHDTAAVFGEIRAFQRETGLAAVNVGVLTPFPGTPVRERFRGEGRLDERAPWSAYTGFNLLFRHDHFSRGSLARTLLEHYRAVEGTTKLSLEPPERLG